MQTQTRVAKAAAIIMVAMIMSRILGYVREMVILAQFGQSSLTDAYNAAFTIPDFLYYIVAGGSLNAAFIPVFSSYIARKEEEEGWRVASTVLNIIVIIMLTGVIIALIFTPQIMRALVPGFAAETLDLSVLMTRIMLVQAFFMALTGVSTGILNSYQNFLAPAIGSVFYNVGIIAVGLILSQYFGIIAFAIGVVVGAVTQFFILFRGARKIGLRYNPTIDLHHPGVRKILGLIVPVLIGMSVSQLNFIVNQNLVSNLMPGMITSLRTAQQTMQLPIGIFAISIATASLPTMSGHFARNDRESLLNTMSLSLRTIIFLALPSAVGLIVLRTPVIRLLFQRGSFTAADTATTAHALLFYCMGLVAYASLHHLNRSFYAIQDTKTPVITSVISIVLNILLNLWLIKPLGHGGAALAYSIAGIIHMMILLYIYKRKLGRIGGKKILISFLQTLAISLTMGLVVYFAFYFISSVMGSGSKLVQLIEVVVSTGLGIVVFAIVALVLRMEEAEMVKSMALRRLRRKR